MAFPQSFLDELIARSDIVDVVRKLQVHTDNISLLSSLSSAYTKGIVVTSAHMAKGLEDVYKRQPTLSSSAGAFLQRPLYNIVF